MMVNISNDPVKDFYVIKTVKCVELMTAAQAIGDRDNSRSGRSNSTTFTAKAVIELIEVGSIVFGFRKLYRVNDYDEMINLIE